ncbi:MAG: UDP-glucose/GDP-mannose dehydrogenase family protein [Phycisphaerae bacterium]|nr:UDP-glucose/GDP-mannose dehydrogenase family protein [Phycisphaerae bacterium]
MKLCVVGTGYVGLVAGTGFAESGNHVVCVDIDDIKIAALKSGKIPIYEPGLKELVDRNTARGRLEFSTDLDEAVKRSRIIFLAVGTPPAPDGSADLTAALDVARTIGKSMDGYRIVVMKSTVPVGTHRLISEAIASQTDHPFDYVSNPEFMKEGAAVEDFLRPDRVVIGANNPAVIEIMRELYTPFLRRNERILIMDPASAEMTKYAANALLATKISFMNEIACLCEHLGADVESVRRGVGSDPRIGDAFLFPGVGFGGSCFPKDVSALVSMGQVAGSRMHIVEAVNDVNTRQRQRFARRVIDHFGEKCPRTTLAVWGLAFKARTDDVRESPALSAVQMFRERGMMVRAHDPEAMANAAREIGSDKGIEMCEDEYVALKGADALVIFTDWPVYRTPDFDRIEELLTSKIVFDGRNLYDPATLARRGFHYVCVGRPRAEAR